MNKKVQSLVLAGIVSANALTPITEVFADSKIETKTGIKVISENISDNQVYLSDINYESESKAGWGQIRKDINVDNNGLIRLNVDGEAKDFEKGMSAHATSTLIYNVSAYKDTYTRLVTYMGIDARRGGNGDGVTFTISTSEDGKTWTEVKKTGVLKGNNESAYVDIELNNANYIKLYAHDNGYNGSDHAMYGDLKLVKADYSLAGTPIEGLQTVDQYDSILKNESIDNNIANNKMTILRRTLVQRVGYESLQRIAGQDAKYNKGINYLMSNEKALNYFIMGGPVNMHGSYQRSLKSFCEIYDKYSNIMNNPSDDYFNLRLAISIALAYSRTETVSSWMKTQQKVNPVHRYEVFQYLANSGKMDEAGNTNNHTKWSSDEFKALPIPMMRWSVDVRMNDDEILWLVDYALGEKSKGKNFVDAYNYIEYTAGHNFDNPEYYKAENFNKYNDKYGFSKYFSDYGTSDQQRMWMAFEEGTVCGGLAQTYSTLADVFGRPSSPCGQPGHAASATYQWNQANNRYEWTLQNNISGWLESGNQFDDRMLGWGDQWKNSWSKWHNASYTILASDAVMNGNYSKYEKANLLVLLADSYSDNNKKRECYEKALEHQNINLDGMERLINCYKSDSSTTTSEYLTLAKKIIDAYTFYPQAMVELLTLIEEKITDVNDSAQLDMLKNNALILASKCTPQQSTNVGMTTQLANNYLKTNQSTELATFSFDGDDAGKIVLNSKYADSEIRVRYSLNGGQTWEQTDEKVIILSKEQLASITADNDIIVGLVGTEATHTIDILEGKTVSGLYANDLENLLIGDEQNLTNLEFSTNGGQTWCNYVGGLEDGIRIEGNTTVKVRYKAYGQYLQSPEVEYNFTEDKDTDERKYIQLKNVSLVECSTPNSNNHKGEHMLDGNLNTGFHTRFSHREQDKFFTVEFDKERYITSIEYKSTGFNGKMRSGRILASLDGKEWIESGRFDEIGYNHDLKTLNLNQPTKCKYIKIIPDLTYGNSEGEKDMYFSGNMFNFYEDTTVRNDFEVESGNGGSIDDPAIIKVNTINGLREILDTIVKDNKMSIGVSEKKEENNIVSYKIDVIDGKNAYHVILKTDNTEIIDILNGMYEQNSGEDDSDDVPVQPEQPEETPEVVPPTTNPDVEVNPNIPPIGDMTPNIEGWVKTDTLVKMHELWNYNFDEVNQTIVLESFKGITTQRNNDLKVEIPRIIDGYKVALADLKSDMFPGVTHIKVAEAKENEGQVKVLATDLKEGFKDNDTLKYVNLDGLEVSEVDNMYGLFSFCKNLRVVEINNWNIKDTTDITAMFYAKMAATDKEKKILVITDNDKIYNYDFEASNRIPCTVTFNANGGNFLGDEEILNMKIARYTVSHDFLENLDIVIEGDVESAGIPIREGFKFTGWYTEDPTPTNFYELLNMTYKAKWEEIVEEETPEDNIPNLPNIEYENGTGGANTPCTLKVNTEEGLDSIMNWLNDKSINMSYYRLKDIINNPDDTITYQLHVFGADKLVSYINIKIDNSSAELMNKLNAINVNDNGTDNTPGDFDKPGIDEDNNQDGDNSGSEQQPSVPPSESMPVPPTTPEPPIGENGSTDNDGNTSQDNIGTPNQPEVKPEIKPEQPSVPEVPEQGTPEFKHEVVELIGGKGQIDNEYELVVKAVEKEVFDNFLQELKGVNTQVISVTKEGNYTLYKIKFDRVSRNTDNSVYAVIKVENEKAELIGALNEFTKETNSAIVLPGQELSDNTDTNVKPEIENNTNGNTNTGNNTLTNNYFNDNPKTGDVGIVGYATLGLTSILGIFKNRRKRK